MEIKELKRRKSRALVIVHDEDCAKMLISDSENCCHIFNKDDVVTEKCVLIVTTYAKFKTLRKSLEGFSQLVIFLDSDPITSIKDLKNFSLCLNREKTTVALMMTASSQAEQFVSWLQGIHKQKIRKLTQTQPCRSLQELLKTSSSSSETIDKIKTPSGFVSSVLRRLSLATDSYMKEYASMMETKRPLEVPLCVEVSPETLTLFLRLARTLYENNSSQESLRSILRVMSLNLNIMCTHRVPGIPQNLVNKIRDLLLELSGIGEKDKVIKDDRVASYASAALEGALELFLPAPEAQVTFVRHLLRGGRKKLLARVLKHLHNSTHCTFSLVPNPTSKDRCPALSDFTKLMISSVFDILKEYECETDADSENTREASLKLIFHLVSNVSSICAMYAAVSFQDNTSVSSLEKPSLNDTISVQSKHQELRSKRLAECTSPIVDMLEIVCSRICVIKKASKSMFLMMRVLNVLLTSLGTYPFDLSSVDSDDLVKLRQRIVQATRNVISHISILRVQEESAEKVKESKIDDVNEMLVRLHTLIHDVDDVADEISTSSSVSSNSTTLSRWEYLFRGRWTPFTPSTLNERLSSARERGLEDVDLRLHVPPHRRHGRRHRREAVYVNVLVSLEENRMLCGSDLTLHDVPVRQVEIEQQVSKKKQEAKQEIKPGNEDIIQ